MNIFIGNVERAILLLEDSIAAQNTQDSEMTKKAITELNLALQITIDHIGKYNWFFYKRKLTKVWKETSENNLLQLDGVTQKEHQFWCNKNFYKDKNSNQQLFKLCLVQALEKTQTLMLLLKKE